MPAIFLAGLLALGGCGFHPLHGRGAGAVSTSDLDRVRILPLSEREGQLLHNYLSQRFNPDGHHRRIDYLLVVRLTASTSGLGVRRDSTATRNNMVMTADFSLLDQKTGKRVFNSLSSVTVSYNILEERFATLASEQDAQRRATLMLADNITQRVSVFFARAKRAG
jgi:LPS-assembly lipoprotein